MESGDTCSQLTRIHAFHNEDSRLKNEAVRMGPERAEDLCELYAFMNERIEGSREEESDTT